MKTVKELVSKGLWAHLKRATGANTPRNIIGAYWCAREVIGGSLPGIEEAEEYEPGVPCTTPKQHREVLCTLLRHAALSLEEAVDELESNRDTELAYDLAYESLSTFQGFIDRAKRVAFCLHLYW